MTPQTARMLSLIPATGCSSEWIRQQTGLTLQAVEHSLQDLVSHGFARRAGNLYRRFNPDVAETEKGNKRKPRVAVTITKPKVDKNARFEELFAFQCRADKLPEPERQFYFAKEMGRQFRSDFAWPQYRLLVEIEGGIWKRGGGAHSHPLDILRDIERRQHAVLLGYHVLPVTTDEVKAGKAIDIVRRVLEARGWRHEEHERESKLDRGR